MSTINVNQMVDSQGGVLAPISSVMRNRIINGAMTIDQRNAGASVSSGFSVDRFGLQFSASSKFTAQQNAGSVTPPTGFSNYLGCTSSAATSLGSTDYFGIYQNIEGFNFSDMQWGTASASTVTLSFWVRSSLTGTFGGALRNSANNRSYPFTYTINSANTWEYETITIAGDTTGTWVGATNGIGVAVLFSLGTGSTLSGTAGAWAGSNFLSATGATSVVGTNGATFYITGVQLEVGTQATSFEYRQYGQELALCYRYFQSIDYAANAVLTIGLCTSTTGAEGPISLLQTMRSTPTITLPAAGQTAGTITYLTSGGAYPSTTGTNTPNYISVNNFAVSGTSYSPNFVQGNASWLYASGSVKIRASAEL